MTTQKNCILHNGKIVTVIQDIDSQPIKTSDNDDFLDNLMASKAKEVFHLTEINLAIIENNYANFKIATDNYKQIHENTKDNLVNVRLFINLINIHETASRHNKYTECDINQQYDTLIKFFKEGKYLNNGLIIISLWASEYQEEAINLMSIQATNINEEKYDFFYTYFNIKQSRFNKPLNSLDEKEYWQKEKELFISLNNSYSFQQTLNKTLPINSTVKKYKTKI